MINSILSDKITINTLHSVYQANGYTIFSNDAKDLNLNIFGVRSSAFDTNTFNDIIGCFWKFNGVWNLKKWGCTTDPGLYYFEHPDNSTDTTHIMKEGQYRGIYQIDKHQGRYDALCQRGPMDFYNDADRDKEFDKDPDNISENVIIGANIHSTINGIVDIKTAKFDKNKESSVVNNWSAACQVFAKPAEYQEFMFMCYKAKDLYGNKFSYTLLDETDF